MKENKRNSKPKADPKDLATLLDQGYDESSLKSMGHSQYRIDEAMKILKNRNKTTKRQKDYKLPEGGLASVNYMKGE